MYILFHPINILQKYIYKDIFNTSLNHLYWIHPGIAQFTKTQLDYILLTAYFPEM